MTTFHKHILCNFSNLSVHIQCKSLYNFLVTRKQNTQQLTFLCTVWQNKNIYLPLLQVQGDIGVNLLQKSWVEEVIQKLFWTRNGILCMIFMSNESCYVSTPIILNLGIDISSHFTSRKILHFSTCFHYILSLWWFTK
jgi:hypothetical protein